MQVRQKYSIYIGVTTWGQNFHIKPEKTLKSSPNKSKAKHGCLGFFLSYWLKYMSLDTASKEFTMLHAGFPQSLTWVAIQRSNFQPLTLNFSYQC